jgi:dihydroorotate dehydrogenase (NAD+) catalytic subunit
MAANLAPDNKIGLRLASPVIAGSGAAGFGDAWPPGLRPEMFGAQVTAPLGLRAQRGQAPPRLAELPGGYVLATGDHNPGYSRVVRDHAASWTRAGIPVIVALAGTAVNDWSRLASRLEEETVAAGLEPALPVDVVAADAAALVGAVRRSSILPLLALLPATQAARLAGACASAGADALVIGAPPTVASPGPAGALVEGRLGGPAALPFTLQALQAVARLELGLPVVAAGGIYRIEDARLCMELGASAVQVRGLLWSDPAAAARLCAALRGEAEAAG